MKQLSEAVDYVLQEQQRQWIKEGIPVMTAVITIPQFSKGQTDRVPRRLGRYYRQCARSFLFYCDRYLYPRALAEFNHARQTGAYLPCAAASLKCAVACNREHVFSLYTDCTE